jgi:hypothetical protein
MIHCDAPGYKQKTSWTRRRETELFQVKRLERATLSTPDFEHQIAYWSEILGEDDCFLGTQLGEETIALERGFLRPLSLQIKPRSDVNEIIVARDQAEKRRDISPSAQKAVTFTDPKSTLAGIYPDRAFAANSEHEAGIRPIKFRHVPCRVNDVKNAHSMRGLNLSICSSSRSRALNKNGTAARKQPNA